MLKPFSAGLVLAASAAMWATAAHADGTVTIYSSGDASINSYYNGTSDQYQQPVGFYNGQGRDDVFVFQLPTLMAGETFSDASLRVFFGGYDNNDPANATPAYDADLYGLAGSTSNAVSVYDYYAGSDDTSAGTVLLQNDLVPASITADNHFTSSTSADSAIAQYVNTQYAANGAGSYVFLRVNPSVASSSNSGYELFTDNNNYTDGIPQLTLTETPAASPAPEPSQIGLIALMGLGLGGLILRARRARRAAPSAN